VLRNKGGGTCMSLAHPHCSTPSYGGSPAAHFVLLLTDDTSAPICQGARGQAPFHQTTWRCRSAPLVYLSAMVSQGQLRARHTCQGTVKLSKWARHNQALNNTQLTVCAISSVHTCPDLSSHAMVGSTSLVQATRVRQGLGCLGQRQSPAHHPPHACRALQHVRRLVPLSVAAAAAAAAEGQPH
jgi:hypothetical protein